VALSLLGILMSDLMGLVAEFRVADEVRRDVWTMALSKWRYRLEREMLFS
jgi:hypothetical protein